MEELLDSIKLRPQAQLLEEKLLMDLLMDSVQDVKDFINNSDLDTASLPEGLKQVIKELVLIKINHMGAEGIASVNSNGISESYLEDIPKPLKKKLYHFRKVF